MFALVVLSRMDCSTLWAGDTESHTTSRNNKFDRVRYVGHAAQMLGVVKHMRILNLATHSETCAAGLHLTDALHRDGVLPPERQEVFPCSFVERLVSGCTASSELPTQPWKTDSMVDDIALDEVAPRAGESQWLFRRHRTGHSPQWSSWAPDNPPCTPLGEAVRDASLRSPVCKISGRPGVGKTKRMPAGLLGALMTYESLDHHGIVVIMEQKEAQNALFEHIRFDAKVLSLCFLFEFFLSCH